MAVPALPTLGERADRSGLAADEPRRGLVEITGWWFWQSQAALLLIDPWDQPQILVCDTCGRMWSSRELLAGCPHAMPPFNPRSASHQVGRVRGAAARPAACSGH